MTQGRLKTSKARSAKATSRKASQPKPPRARRAKANRKKSAAPVPAKQTRAAKKNIAKKASAKGRVDAAKANAVPKKATKTTKASKASAVSKPVARTRGSSKAKPQAHVSVKSRPPSSPGAARSRSKRGVAATEVERDNKQPTKMKPQSPGRPVQLGLGFDDKQDAFAVLQQQNKRLLVRIAQRRASLTLLRQLSEELMQEASQRVLPYREELKALTREVLDLESRVLGAEGLVGRNRDQVRLVLHELLRGLPQDELDADVEEDFDGASKSSANPSERTARSVEDASAAHESTHLSSQESATVGVSHSAAPEKSQANDAPKYAPSQTPAQSEAAQPEAQSAAKPAGDQSGALRSLFKRLVIQWHPDRVRDDDQKTERTKLMKEFTQAFEGGDLAKLVALEQTLSLKHASTQAVSDSPEKRAEHLRRANEELSKQLLEVQASLEAVREDCPFTLDYRKKDPASGARDELDEFVLVNHLAVKRATETRDFVLSFAQGRMTIAEFLQGLPRRS